MISNTETDFTTIFDKDHTSGWKQAGPGGFKVENGIATSYGGMGLWYHETMYTNFVLRLEFKQDKITCNSGVFIRFPRVDGDPWHPVKEGYEVQIYADKPHKNTTGAIYDFQAATEVPIKPAGEWNEFEISCIGQEYKVYLNGTLINTFTGSRSTKGMVGMQNHDDHSIIQFRNIRTRKLPE